ncbi:MAG: peptidoglycan-binding protein [Saprospiraceae bacterium]|nr:peptidoglycan-binding protein [Saprospiraceae bacterium]
MAPQDHREISEHSALSNTIQDGEELSRSLFVGSLEKDLIIDLQRNLFELGFRSELKFTQYQADGNYGPATATAVLTFAQQNKFASDGNSVSSELAKLILDRHAFLPEMYLLWNIHTSDLRTRKYVSKGTRMSIRAVQRLLNEIGYGAQLNFPKYGADGLYGNSTKNAIVVYASDHGIDSDGDLLTRPLINLMLESINTFTANIGVTG